MQALRQLIKPTNGSITIAIPEEYANKELEVTIRPIASLGNNKKKYDFSDIIGKLQWKGDALEEQKKLRDEWE
jgi:hypothetical protein